MRLASLLATAAAAAVATPVQYPLSTTWEGGRGLSQTRSAEGLGAGTLVIGMRGALNPTDYPISGTPQQSPDKGAYLTTGMLSFSYGLNDYFDIGTWGTLFNVSKGTNYGTKLGAGGVNLQWSFPLDTALPLRLALHGGAIAGTSQRQVIQGYDYEKLWYRPDGYSYYETRTGYDFSLRALATLRLGTPQFPVRIHGNGGIVTSLQDSIPTLTVVDGGMELVPAPWLSIAGEGHLRTVFKKPDVFNDPLWATGSIIFHMPHGTHLALGSDVNLSTGTGTRLEGTHSLEKWRVFGQLTFTTDLLAARRAALAEKLRNDSLEKVRLMEEVAAARRLTDSLAKAKRDDSLAALSAAERARYTQDSLRTVERMRQDSLIAAQRLQDSLKAARNRALLDSLDRQRRADSLAALANADLAARQRDSLLAKMRQDSIDAANRLAEARKNDPEAEFLRTGVLNLESVTFMSGKATLTQGSKPYLNLMGKMLARIVTKYPQLRMEVGGHTDNVGRPAANMLLSKQRATTVRSYLVGNFPNLGKAMTAQGYGQDNPVADNDTPEGREQNRRVEITVTNREILQTLQQSAP